MGKHKYFYCSKCDKKHQRPVGKNCTVIQPQQEDLSELDTSSSSSSTSIGASASSAQDMNVLLLAEMKNLSSKMNSMVKRLATTEKQLQSASTSDSQQQRDKGKKFKQKVPPVPQIQSSDEDSSDPEVVMPSKKFIKKDGKIQEQVRACMGELKHMNDKDYPGKFKSQRSSNDDVTVKFKIPWPQNQVLSGSTRSRPSYDQLNVYQWVSGFACIAQDEIDIEVKNKCWHIWQT